MNLEPESTETLQQWIVRRGIKLEEDVNRDHVKKLQPEKPVGSSY